jgi:hypothetical protein
VDQNQPVEMQFIRLSQNDAWSLLQGQVLNLPLPILLKKYIAFSIIRNIFILDKRGR